MNGERKPRERKQDEMPANDFVRLLDYLKATRGFDFSGYKLSSLVRRVQKRMQQVGVGSYSDYSDYLEVHPDEFTPLFNTVLINVTSFFRDPQAWEVVKEQILPRILESKTPDEPIRCWSAGCASGEEAYTLAILLAEALGDVEYRQRVKIYGTDADEEALAQARQGVYTPAQAEAVPEELRSKYFDRHGDRCTFRQDLRRSLIFGRHDLVQDAAISRVDLLICRNTLMYFNSETQAKILARFHFALSRNGYLFLGKAETLLSHGNSFRPEDLKARIFQRTASASLRERLLALTPASTLGDIQGVSRPVRVREAAFDAGPVAQIAVDRTGRLALANGKARQLFNLAPADLGRLLQDLEISYRPVELRSHIDAVSSSRLAVTLKNVEWRPVGGEPRVLEIGIIPLLDAGGLLQGTGVSFLDNTTQTHLHSELERAKQELETAYEELPVRQRGAGDDQRRAPVHHRGAGDDQRGAPVGQRRAGNHERGAPVHQRRAARPERPDPRAVGGAAARQHPPPRHPRQPAGGGRGPRPGPGGGGLERKGAGSLGPARRRGPGHAVPVAGHRPARGAVAGADLALPERRRPLGRRGDARRRQPARPAHSVPGHVHPLEHRPGIAWSDRSDGRNDWRGERGSPSLKELLQ